MHEIRFNSITDLYQRLYPALTTKKDLLNSTFKTKIKEFEIWCYFKNMVWNQKHDLTLADMVNDILNTDDVVLYEYIQNEMFKGKK